MRLLVSFIFTLTCLSTFNVEAVEIILGSTVVNTTFKEKVKSDILKIKNSLVCYKKTSDSTIDVNQIHSNIVLIRHNNHSSRLKLAGDTLSIVENGVRQPNIEVNPNISFEKPLNIPSNLKNKVDCFITHPLYQYRSSGSKLVLDVHGQGRYMSYQNEDIDWYNNYLNFYSELTPILTLKDTTMSGEFITNLDKQNETNMYYDLLTDNNK